MCLEIDRTQEALATGIFQKGNEPDAMQMSIIYAPCKCGATFWARVEGGKVWVEAERVK